MASRHRGWRSSATPTRLWIYPPHAYKRLGTPQPRSMVQPSYRCSQTSTSGCSYTKVNCIPVREYSQANGDYGYTELYPWDADGHFIEGPPKGAPQQLHPDDRC